MAEPAEDIEGVLAASEGEDETPQSNPEAEKVAKLMGWKPKDAWKGDDSKWRPAEDFLAEVPDIMKALRKTTATQRDKLDRIVGEVAKLSSNQRRELDAKLDAALEQAIEDGDKAEQKKILAQIRQVNAPEAAEDPAVVSFKERNDWYGDDEDATTYADAMDSRIVVAAGGRDKIGSMTAHLKKIEAAVQKRFPELFDDAPAGKKADEEDEEKPARRGPPLVNRGGRTATPNTATGLTVSTMTAEQRAAAKTMEVAPEKYVENFNKWNAPKPRQTA